MLNEMRIDDNTQNRLKEFMKKEVFGDCFGENRGVRKWKNFLIDLMSFRNNPLDRFEELLQEKPPIILVSGDAGTIVPFDENGKLLYDFYTQNGGKIELYMKKGGDHHPYGLENNEVIADFIERYY